MGLNIIYLLVGKVSGHIDLPLKGNSSSYFSPKLYWCDRLDKSPIIMKELLNVLN